MAGFGPISYFLYTTSEWNKVYNYSEKSKKWAILIADELGFSLGKLNYCLQALKKSCLLKISNYKKNPNKLSYAYILTPKGIAKKTTLTINFMKRKMQEYEELKREIGK